MIARVYRGPNGLTGTREGTMPLSTYVRSRPRSRPPLPGNHRKAMVACGHQRKPTETRPEFNQIQPGETKFNLFADKVALKSFCQCAIGIRPPSTSFTSDPIPSEI
jgi:hypothetical protein